MPGLDWGCWVRASSRLGSIPWPSVVVETMAGMSIPDARVQTIGAADWETAPVPEDITSSGVEIVAADEATVSVLVTNYGSATVWLGEGQSRAAARDGQRVVAGGFVSLAVSGAVWASAASTVSAADVVVTRVFSS